MLRPGRQAQRVRRKGRSRERRRQAWESQLAVRYSDLRRTTGSIQTARRSGIREATTLITSSTIQPAAKEETSKALTRNKSGCKNGVVANAADVPTIKPSTTGHRIFERITRRTCLLSAPRATRSPTSRVRSATNAPSTPNTPTPARRTEMRRTGPRRTCEIRGRRAASRGDRRSWLLVEQLEAPFGIVIRRSYERHLRHAQLRRREAEIGGLQLVQRADKQSAGNGHQ